MTKPADGSEMKKSIAEAVREALAEKEAADRQSKVEELLNSAEDTVRDLTETIQGKEAELAAASEERNELLAQVEELKAKADELEAKLADANKSSEELQERASTAEAELHKIAADRALEVRMANLEEAKVAKSGEKREAQAERVRGMSDEEFAAYKEELIELRQAVEAELKEKAANSEGADESEDEGDGVEVAAADIEGARRSAEGEAAANTLNVETASEDLRAKFARFGKAMAANLSKDPRDQ